MKKSIIILFSIVAAFFTSCTIDPLFKEEGGEGTTTVTFTPNFGLLESGTGTKAFAEAPQINNLYLAVFSQNGKALIEYVKAEPVSPASTNEPDKYKYTVRLKVSSQPRVIHFIANAPEEIGYGSDVDAVGTLNYTFNQNTWKGEDAYWGYLKLDNGICKEGDPGFAALKEDLSGVTLVRNFAKIKVETADDSNFTITRFWISNFPESSTAAPYNRVQRRFETAYASYGYASSAMAAGYQGFCPAYSELISIDGLSDDKLASIACAPGTAAYSYEREMPVSDPLCLIVGGTSNLSATETFYKIDLRDSEGNYLPLLRNFIYPVKIGQVYKVGEATVEAALKSVSSGAIDTDISLQGLKDLSNGKSRIAVSETDKVLFDDKPFDLLYSFIPDINNGVVVNRTLGQWVSEGYYDSEADVIAEKEPYVTIAFTPGMSGNVIDSYTLTDSDDSDGYRKVNMIPVPTGNIVKTEVVTITGHVYNSSKGRYETLQRTVNYQMRKRLDMTLAITPDRVKKAIGEELTLTIGIEENLPRSLFTINLKITTEQMTLTPVGKDLPISSEVGSDGKPAFFMTKAITWEEYNSTPSVEDSDGIRRKHFDCKFKTNTSNFREVDPSFGDGDRIIVNSEDFNETNAFFIAGNDDKNRFVSIHLDKEYFVAARPANIVFGMTKLPSDGKIYVKLKDLQPADTASATEVGADGDYTIYEMNVKNARQESLAVVPTIQSGEVNFQLVHDEFNQSTIFGIEVKKASFANLKFNYNNLEYVVAGKPAQATFHMDYTPVDGYVTIHLKNAVPVDSTLIGTGEANGYTAYSIPVSENDESFPVKIDPADGETNAYFKLTADNFTNSNEATAPIQKLNFSKLKLINVNNTSKEYVVGDKPARIAFTLDDMPGDGVITIKLNNLTLGSGRTGVSAVEDKGDGKYELSVTDYNVTLDVTPAFGKDTASYELTDSEFNDADTSAPIRLLSFDGLKLINVNNPGKEYVVGNKPARISFTMEDMPGDGAITIELNNLTLGSGRTGVSAVEDKGDGKYELSVTDYNVTLDVTPAFGKDTASYKLTDSEFNDADTGAPIRLLSFNTYSLTNKASEDRDKTYLIKGNSAVLSFTMEDMPEYSTVDLTLTNLTPDSLDPASGKMSGISAITVSDGVYVLTVNSKNVTLDVTPTASGNHVAEATFRATGFTDAAILKDVKTRYIVNWANVQITTDDSSYPKAVSKTVSVFSNAECTTAATDFSEVSTGNDGFVTNDSIVIDVFNTTGKQYYFKFFDNDISYTSAKVTLDELGQSKTSQIAIECKYKLPVYTIAAKALTIKVNNGDLNGGTVYYTTSRNKSGSFSVTSGNPKGQNSNAVPIEGSVNDTIHFECTDKGTTYAADFTINAIKNGGTFNLPRK